MMSGRLTKANILGTIHKLWLHKGSARTSVCIKLFGYNHSGLLGTIRVFPTACRPMNLVTKMFLYQ